MGKVFEVIDEALASWIADQHLFFVATAPLAGDGLVNCSPKGMDSFRVLGPNEAAYLDLTGSGIETIAHLQENGRIVIMFCAFQGAPRIVRLHGTGSVITSDHPDWAELSALFPAYPGTRAIIRIAVSRISDSCGFAVPRYEYLEDRDTLVRWAESKGEDALADYRAQKNADSLDGLPGMPP